MVGAGRSTEADASLVESREGNFDRGRAENKAAQHTSHYTPAYVAPDCLADPLDQHRLCLRWRRGALLSDKHHCV